MSVPHPTRKPEPDGRRTYQYVRRDSLEAGGPWEERFVTRLTRTQLLRLKGDANEHDWRTRMPNCMNGAIGGPMGRDILEYLCRQAIKFGGRVILSYEQIALATHVSYASVGRKLKVLRDLGIVTIQRRFERVEVGPTNPRGDQVKQVANMIVINYVHAVFTARREPAPKPDDDLERRRERQLQRDLFAAAANGVLAATAKLGTNVYKAALKRGDASAGPIPDCPELDFDSWPAATPYAARQLSG